MNRPIRPSLGERYFPALQQRNFRLFWIGQLVSVIGTWMQNIGQDWLVLELTGSAAKLSVVAAVQFLPMMLLSLFAGPVIDRYPKKRTLVFTQSALAVLALALSIITATHIVRYWMILVLALLLGLVTLVDNPTRQSYVIELSGREALVNAVSLNSAAFNAARIFGPGLAGLLIEAIGIAPCFLLNALSFIAVIAALLRIDAREGPRKRAIVGMRELVADAREGVSYIRARKEIALPIALLAIVSTIVINYNVFVPTFAKITLGRTASGYGFLMTSMGFGALAAALMLAVRSGKGPSKLRLYGGALGLCASLGACGLQRSYALSCVLLALSGFAMISFVSSTNATLQLSSDDGHRGRVMSVYSLVFGGVTPIGSLYAGAVSELAGPGFAMALSGGLGLVASALLLRGRSSHRPPGPRARGRRRREGSPA
jgi:MFS family permease